MGKLTNFLTVKTTLLIVLQLFLANSLFSKSPFEEIRKLIFQQPEVAKHQLDSISKQLSILPTQYSFEYYNNLGVYYGVYGNYELSKNAFLKSLKYTDNSTTSYANSLLSLCIVHTKTGHFDSSLQFADSALAIYQTQNDTNGIVKTFGEKGTAYKSAGILDLAVTEYLNAIELLQENPKNTAQKETLAIIKQKLANTYLENNRYDFAKKLYAELIPELKQFNNTSNVLYTIVNYAWAHYNLKEYTEGLAIINDLLQSDELINPEIKILALTTRADFYIALNKTEAAITDYEAALQLNSNTSRNYIDKLYTNYLKILNDTKAQAKALALARKYKSLYSDSALIPELYLNIAKTYQNANILDTSILNWEIYNHLFLKQLEQNNAKTLNQLQSIYQNDILEKEIEIQEADNLLLQNKVEFRTRMLILLIVGTIVLAILAFYLWYSTQLKSKLKSTQLEKIEQEKQFIESQADIVKENLQLKEQVIQEQKAQLLSSTLESAALNQKIEDLIAKIASKASLNLTNELRDLNSNGNHWKVTVEKFKQINPTFIDSLSAQYPELTTGELEFCALVKMNLTYKEIANLLKINHQSVFMKKYRITKKLNISEDDDFLQLIRNIE